MNYSKKEIKFAFDNPYICPCCKKRFKSKILQEKHWKENKTCGTYAFDGKVAVLKSIRGYMDSIEEWERNNPFKKFIESL